MEKLKNGTVTVSTLLLILLVAFSAASSAPALADMGENGEITADDFVGILSSGAKDKEKLPDPDGTGSDIGVSEEENPSESGDAHTQEMHIIGYEEERQVIPFSTVMIPTDTLPYGVEEVVSEGQDGEMLCRYKISVCSDGSTRRTLERRQTEREAIDRVVMYGSCKETPFNEFIYPTAGIFTSGFGYRTLNGVRKFHYGIDIANDKGTSVVASDSGRVVLADASSSYGNYIIIDHGNGFSTCYAHLSKICVEEGDAVARGEEIGKMGSTGRATGVHLHFEIRLDETKVDPLLYLSDELCKQE